MILRRPPTRLMIGYVVLASRTTRVRSEPHQGAEAAIRVRREPASITVIPDLSHLTPVRPSVLFRHGFDWPRVGSEAENGISIMCARPYDLFPKIADHVIEMMQHDGIVVGWTSQTETAAFEYILDWLAEQYRVPRVVIVSPEGTFSGRLGAARLALGNGPTLSQAASGPTL